MKSHVLSCTLLALVVSLPVSAQRGTGRGSGNLGGFGVPRSTRSATDINSSGNLFLAGKVVLEDGSEPGQAASIQTVCRGQKHSDTYSDSHGNFSFQFASRLTAYSGTDVGDADTSMGSNNGSTRSNARSAQDCELQVSLPGFVSPVIELSAVPANTETYNVGRIVLHRLAQVQGLTISATSAAAPDSARKLFEKGIDQEKQGKWDEAQQSFENAVRLYDKYAVAWFELGRIQQQKNDTPSALQSFGAAVAADPKYVSPYQFLMKQAVKEGRWPTVIDLTAKMLALNSVSFPDAWFFNSAGNYLLKNFDAAENSARQGIKVDAEHHFPRFEYLLGMILVERHQYSEAATHFRQFLQVAKTSLETEEGRKQLAEAERLSATASVPAP